MGSFRVVNPLEEPGWDELVVTHPGSNFFHTSCWARVLRDCYGFTPCYLLRMDGGNIAGLFPSMDIRSFVTGCRGVSLPFTDFCDLLIPDGMNIPDAMQEMARVGSAKGWRTIEIRHRGAEKSGIPASAQYIAHELDLKQGEKNIYSRLSQNLRRNIQRAAARDVRVDIDNSRDGIRHFFRLNCLTRREHGIPPQPFRFFSLLHAHVLSAGKGNLLLARHKGRVVSGNLYLHHGSEAIYKYGASDRRFQELRASHLVMWEGIRLYAEKGYNLLHMGRTDLGHEGLRRFKLGWGATESPLTYLKYDIHRREFMLDRPSPSATLHGIIRALPIPVLRCIGALAYRHAG